jgi:hypothetical protein
VEAAVDLNEINTVVADFLDTVRVDPDFTEVWEHDTTMTRAEVSPGVGLWLKDGTDIPCRVVARDTLGNYSVVTEDGAVRQYLGSEVL